MLNVLKHNTNSINTEPTFKASKQTLSKSENIVQDNEKNKEKLKLAMTCLAIAGASAITVGGIYAKKKISAKDIGKFTKRIVETKNGEKVIQKYKGTKLVKEIFCKNPNAKKTSEPTLRSIKYLENKRISATYKIGKKTKTIELPEFLYHFTNANAHESIQSSGVLKPSTFKTAGGVYLVDSKNFFKYYKNTDVDGETLDLFTSLVAKTGLRTYDADSLGYVYQIPTRDLLANGKLKIRTQEDYFRHKKFIQNIDNQIEELTNETSILSFIGLDNEKARANFIKQVKELGLMSDDDLAKFFSDEHKKLDVGYDIFEAFAKKLEDTKSIEYIYDGDIKLSDFSGIKAKGLPFSEYFSLENATADYNRFKELFEQAFVN